MDIFRTGMRFLWANIMFYDAVTVIHDVITTANPFPYTAKFIFVFVPNNRTLNRTLKDLMEYVFSVAVYQKYLTRLGERIIFLPRLKNYRFSQPC